MHNTKQPGMLKKHQWDFRICFLCILRCANPQKKHEHRILRDSLKLGLNNQKTIYIMLPQRSDNHYEGGLRSDELGRKRRKKKNNLHTNSLKFIRLKQDTHYKPLQLTKIKKRKFLCISWKLEKLIINTACKAVNS